MWGVYNIEQSWYPKAVSGTGVDKCGNVERRVGNKQRGQGNMERVGIGKSRRVESDNLGKGTERVNTVLRLCGGLGTAQSCLSESNRGGDKFVQVLP